MGFADSVPVWLILIGTIILVMLSTWVGNRFGRLYRERIAEDAPVNAVTGAHLGLLAFFLAFTFNMASSHFDARRKLIINEVNEIAAANFAAGLIPDQDRGARIREHLRRYVAIRASLNPEASIMEAIRDSEALHRRMKEEITAIAREQGFSAADAHLARTLTRVFDYHNQRVAAAFHYRIPASIWPALYAILVFSMIGLGYTFGLKNTRNHIGSLALALSFSMVIFLTSDLDRPTSGLLVADQSAYQRLLEKMAGAQGLSAAGGDERPAGSG